MLVQEEIISTFNLGVCLLLIYPEFCDFPLAI